MGTHINTAITPEQLQEWLRTASPGSKLEYYRGHLAYDREGLTELNGKTAHIFNEPVDSVAAMLWRAYRQGHVELVQVREDRNVFRYIAIKRSKRK